MKKYLRFLKSKEVIFWIIAFICIILLTKSGFSQEKPGPTNTGYTGTLTESDIREITVDGTVVENKILTGGVYIYANNVTIRNCLFIGGTNGIWAKYGYINLLVEDCEFIQQESCAIFGTNFTMRRCNIHEEIGDAIKPNGNVVIEYNWIHHIGMGENAHADGIQSRGNNHNMTIRYNNFDLPIGIPGYNPNAAIFFEDAYGDITNTYIEYNWLNGGNMTVSTAGNPDVWVRYNKIGRDYRYNYFRSGVINHSCNVWEDTGEPVDACDDPAVAIPVISPNEGIHQGNVTVSISSATSGAEIRYTLDGSDPAPSSQLYSGSFVINSTTTVKARGYKTDMVASSTATATYVIASGVNIAEGKTTVESTYQNEPPDYVNPGSNAVDGNTSDNSRWSAEGYPQWVEIDLGSNQEINGIHLYTYQSRDYQYIVEAKPDGGSYSTIVDRSGNTTTTQPIEDNVSTTARYIKVTVTGAATYTGSWISLNEIMVLSPNSGTTVPVTGVSISFASLNLEEGETSDLNETVSPSNATNKSVTWASSNASVATVNAYGLVTAVSAGSANVTVTTNDGSYTASCSVTVTAPQPPPTGNTYYCDPVSGSMSNNGSQGSPWSTLEAVFAAGKTFAEGDVIYLMNGHHGAPSVTSSNSGMVTIEAAAGQSPTLARITFSLVSNWKIDGVTISPSTAATYVKSNILTVSNSSNIIVENCEIYSVSDPWTTDTDWNAYMCHGIRETGVCNNTIYRNNHIKNVDFGVLMGGSSVNTLIEDNLIENIGGDGIQSQSSYTTIQYNTIQNCYNVNNNHDDGIQVYTRGTDGTVGEGNSIGVVIRSNKIISNTDPNRSFIGNFQGVGAFDGMYTDWLVENNLIITSHYHGISLYGAVNCKIINNTVIDPDQIGSGPLWIKIEAHKDGTPSTGNAIRNNICSDMANDASIGVVENNIIVSYADYNNYFVDYTANDYHLNSGCAAIDAGSAINAPSVDIEGNSRPLGNGYDIGAYEYTGSLVSVTGVSLSASSLTLDIEANATLTATVSPSNATNQSVTWSSSNAAVAHVDNSGVVTGLSAGTVTITVTTNDGGYSANCTVTVNAPTGDYNIALFKPVTVTADDAPVNIGANLVNNNTADNSRWSADGFPQSAEIDLGWDHNLSGVELYTYQSRAYQYIIEAKADGGSYATIVDRSSNTNTTQPIADAVSTTARYVKITVSGADVYTGTWVSLNELKVYGNTTSQSVSVTGVSVSPASLNLTEGASSDLTETIAPANATDKSVSWSSSNTSVATVNASGLVTAISAGTATITVTTNDGGFTATCNVTVSPAIIPVTGISVAPVSAALNVGVTVDLTETISPIDATDKSVTWTTSYASVATVDANGLVTAIAEGTSIITATTNDGGFTASCTVTVNVPQNYFTIINGSTDDTEVRSNNSVAWAGETEIRIGGSSGSYDGCAIIPFQLPVLDNGESIISANFSIYLAGKANSPTHNADMYGIDFRTSSSALASDYYQGNYGSDANNTALLDNLITPSSNNGYISTNSQSLVDFINAQYAAGAQGGEYVFIRLNPDQADVSSYKYYKVNTANSSAKPTLELGILGEIDVTGITLNPTSLTLDEGETSTLTKTISPANASNKAVIWSTSNSAIATVNSSGMVTAISAGTATITATTDDGSYTATCAVTVIDPTVYVTGVSVSPTSLNLFISETSGLTETVSPVNATDKSVTWSSNNASVATVNSNGLVTAISAGTATITVTTDDGGYTATCAVTVIDPTVYVTGVSVSPTSLNLLVSETSDLTETVSPVNATDKSVTWSSNNASVATVNSNGLVTAIAEGTCTITVTTTDGGFTATCTVNVLVPQISTVTIDASTSDTEVRSNNSVAWAGEIEIRIGGSSGSYDGCAVIPFQLPVLATGESIISANFSIYLAGKANSPTHNADMYGIDFRASSSALASDYYQGDYGSDANNTALLDNLITPSSNNGYISTNTQSLVDFINAQYVAGAQGGEYIFIRLNPDQADVSSYKYYKVNTANSSAKPTLELEIESYSWAKIESESNIAQGYDFEIYPNPSNGNFNINLLGYETDEQIAVDIFDISGKRVYSSLVNVNGTQHTICITDKSIVTRGIYIVTISNGKQLKQEKLIVR